MIELKGKYTSAIIYTNLLEANCQKHLYELLNHEAFTNQVRVMPDVHEGKGAVIGFTMPMTQKVIPNVIGVDIGCGMRTIKLGSTLPKSIEKMDEYIRSNVPFGTDVHNEKFAKYLFSRSWLEKVNLALKKLSNIIPDYEYELFNETQFKKICEKVEMNSQRAFDSIGTLGGGNHFIELGISEDNTYWLTIHSGSRQLGQKVAIYHQRKAGKGELAFLEGRAMGEYLADMVVCQMYASLNREIMNQLIIQNSDLEVIECIHNYINFDDMIIRKGAISSYKNEKIIIPLNMEDGILICEGKSNSDWNYSAPHGAGRIDSRKWCKENLNLEEAQERMKQKGIYASKLPIDEIKGAYKNPDEIISFIEPTATILQRVKPILACKE